MPDPRLLDPAVKSLTVGLVSYLREYLLKVQPDKVRDGIEVAKVFWLANVRSRLSVSGFDLPCPPSGGAHAPPSRVRRLLVAEEAWRDVDGAEPSLSAAADAVAREQYDRWLPGWRRWAAEEAANRQLRVDYAALDGLRRGADDRGDTHELVLGVGLLTTGKGGRRTVRRHLLVCDVTITVDPVTEMLHVALPATPDWRAEDREFLDGADGFREGSSGLAMPVGMTPDEVGDWLQEWRRRSWETDLALEVDQWTAEDGDGAVAKLALAPALILRPRSQSGLLDQWREAQKRPRPVDPDTLFQSQPHSGTHSIIDIARGVSTQPSMFTVSPLTPQQLLESFATTTPTDQQTLTWAKRSGYSQYRTRWEGVYVVSHDAGGQPDQIIFAGYSGD